MNSCLLENKLWLECDVLALCVRHWSGIVDFIHLKYINGFIFKETLVAGITFIRTQLAVPISFLVSTIILYILTAFISSKKNESNTKIWTQR